MTTRTTPRDGVPAGVRTAVRALTVTAGLGLPVVLASPAFAVTQDDGSDPGKGLSAGETLLLFGVAPLALFLVIALLVAAPSLARGPRYRPGLGWWAAPVWFGGPEGDPEAAVQAAEPVAQGGGTSARW